MNKPCTACLLMVMAIESAHPHVHAYYVEYFLFECDFYQHIRDVYYQGFREHCNNFDVMNHTEKLNYLMSADVKTTAEFIYKCYCKRREFIYK